MANSKLFSEGGFGFLSKNPYTTQLQKKTDSDTQLWGGQVL